MQNLTEIIRAFKQKKILVVGDLMLDRWTYGHVRRLSPEAPVPVIEKVGEKVTLGGAANVANNLSSLGARVHLCGVIGDDRNGTEILNLLGKAGIAADGIRIVKNRPTTEKHRIVSDGSHQLLRLDLETTLPLDGETREELVAYAVGVLDGCDAVIFSDYAKGVFSRELAQAILAEAKKRGVAVLADFKPQNRSFFYGVDLISPNLEEGMLMTGAHAPQEIGKKLVDEFGAYVVLTRGSDGMSAFRKGDAQEFHVPGKKIKVFDISGAGDTAVAALALALASGASVQDAATLSNEAGAIVVQKPGTATLSAEELVSACAAGSRIENLQIVPKLWGHEKWVENNDKYCCKILSVNKGYQCSLHYHEKKDETFVVTQGHIRLELGSEVHHLYPGSFMRIPPKTPHRFTGIEDSLITEVSTHHDEADSFRLEKSRKAPEFI